MIVFNLLFLFVHFWQPKFHDFFLSCSPTGSKNLLGALTLLEIVYDLY